MDAKAMSVLYHLKETGLVLKVHFFKFVALAKLFNSNIIEELELEVSDKCDEQKIIDFMINGKNSKNVPHNQ